MEDQNIDGELTRPWPTPEVADGVLLTDGAAQKVKALLEGEGRDDLALRVAVQPGGCSGLRYQLFFDEPTSRATWSRTSTA